MKKNKCVLITGASKGIGKATALLLAQESFDLILWARNEKDLIQLKNNLEQYNTNIWIDVVDITDKNQIIKGIENIRNQGLNINYIINNAGIGSFKSIENTEESDWDEQMNCNAKGSFLVSKYTLPFLKEQGQGVIIFVASDAGKRTFENGAAYCASKFAQIAFANVLRAEVRKDNIRVSVICSGLVDTNFNDSKEGSKPHYLGSIEIANTILYILNAPSEVMIDEVMLHPITQTY